MGVIVELARTAVEEMVKANKSECDLSGPSRDSRRQEHPESHPSARQWYGRWQRRAPLA
jgi:hypothetical protein